MPCNVEFRRAVAAVRNCARTAAAPLCRSAAPSSITRANRSVSACVSLTRTDHIPKTSTALCPVQITTLIALTPPPIPAPFTPPSSLLHVGPSKCSEAPCSKSLPLQEFILKHLLVADCLQDCAFAQHQIASPLPSSVFSSSAHQLLTGNADASLMLRASVQGQR